MWLTKIEAAIKVRPIVYTAAFMSDVIGTNFDSYTLWVANYATSCPTMPSGWTDWHFWQNADNGSVAGITGNVDTDFFNGPIAQLQTLTIKAASGLHGVSDTLDGAITASGATPIAGSEGATLGSGTPTQETTGAPITPCR